MRMRMTPLRRSRSHAASSSLVLFLVGACRHWSVVDSTPASHESFSQSYPEGTSTGMNELLIGTPSYHFTIAESEGDGWYATVRNDKGEPVYAIVDKDGKYAPTDQIVGQDLPPQESFKAEETLPAQEAKCTASDYCSWKLDNNGRTRTLPRQMKNLVVPFQFADHKDAEDERPLVSEVDLEKDLYNDDEDGLSVQDYFLKQSHGTFQLTSTVAPWYTISKTEAECANDQSGLSLGIMPCLKEALEQALAFIDLEEYDQDGDGKIDSLTFVHTGYGAELGDQDDFSAHYLNRIWSHAWKLDLGGEGVPHTDTPYAIHSAYHGIANAHIARVGIAVHEIAQMLGFPTTYGKYPGYGMGYYDIMSNPYGFDGTQYTCGNMAAPSKLHMGWVTVQEVDEGGGEFTLTTTSAGEEGRNTVLKISNQFPNGEYLLLENRQPLGYDQGLRQGGIAIYHVDEAGGVTPGHAGQSNYPANGNHYRYSLIQADGEFELEQGKDYGDTFDLFHGGYVNGMTPTGPHVVDIEGEETLHRGGEYPNTKSYQNGQVQNTGLTIQDISESATDMTLTIAFEDNAQE